MHGRCPERGIACMCSLQEPGGSSTEHIGGALFFAHILNVPRGHPACVNHPVQGHNMRWSSHPSNNHLLIPTLRRSVRDGRVLTTINFVRSAASPPITACPRICRSGRSEQRPSRTAWRGAGHAGSPLHGWFRYSRRNIRQNFWRDDHVNGTP